MKKVLYFLFLIFLIASCSSGTKYIIKGRIEGAGNITFYLKKMDSNHAVIIDSAISRKGKFVIKGGRLDYPQLVQLIAGDTRKATSFYLENNTITISGNLDSLFKADIKGSKTQDEYKSYVNSNKPLSDKYAGIYKEYQSAVREGNTSRVSELENDANDIMSKMVELQKNFVEDNPHSYVSPSILTGISYDMEADELDKIISSMDASISSLPAIAEIKKRVEVMKTVSVGRKAPDFTLNDVNGNPISLSSKIAGTKLLLIDFWAAWCGPCRSENPNVVKAFSEYHGKGFDILGVSLDRKKEDWVKAITDDKLSWTQVSDLQYWQSPVAGLYAIYAIPANFLIDSEGKIIARNLRGDALYNKLNDILGKN
jgi:peroxiredoxin